MSDFDDLIRQWGKWAYRNRGLTLGYGSNILANHYSPSVYITDDLACLVDEAVSTLRKTGRTDWAEAVTLYALGHTVRDTARYMAVNATSAHRAIDLGKAWVEGYVVAKTESKKT